MDLGLSGKRALITGASKGLGAAIATTLAAEGVDLVLAARHIDHLTALKAQIAVENPHVSVEVIDIDIRQHGSAETLSKLAGWIDILINNAGDIPGGGIDQIDEASWRAAWDLKVFGYINLVRAFYGQMIGRGDGVIVNIVGTAGERPQGSHIAVASGNAALIALSRGIGAESVANGVRVLAVNPGATETDRQIDRLKARASTQLGDENRWRELVADYPFGRLARPEEVAAVVAFMASPRASYVSGTAVTVDGGGSR